MWLVFLLANWKMSGACEWTNKCETAILNAKPTDKWKLIELLSNSAGE